MTINEKTTRENCIDMAESLLCYNYAHIANKDAREAENDAGWILQHELKRPTSYLKEYVDKLGQDAVQSILADLLSRIKCIHVGIVTDSEGCSYNSIEWVGEK